MLRGWPKSKLEHRELSLVHPLAGVNCSVDSHGGEVWAVTYKPRGGTWMYL